MSGFYILNTRTNGQNPNILGAYYNNDKFTPTLAVSNNGQVPSNLVSSLWSLIQVEPGLYHLKITSPENNVYILGVDSATSSNPCVLIPEKDPNISNYNALWAFPYKNEPRIILIYSQTQNASLSLDSGRYPEVMVWDFVSSVNQTWQISLSANPFIPTPPSA